MNQKDARAILGVSRDCSLAELTKRYHIRALRLHPDKNGNTPEATAAFQEVNAAYRTLLPTTTNTDSSPTDAAAFDTYSNIIMNFMKSLFQPCQKEEPDRGTPILLELLHRIVHDYASVSVNAALDFSCTKRWSGTIRRRAWMPAFMRKSLASSERKCRIITSLF